MDGPLLRILFVCCAVFLLPFSPALSQSSSDEIELAKLSSECEEGLSLTESEIEECEDRWCLLALSIGTVEVLEKFLERFPEGNSACHDLALNAVGRADGDTQSSDNSDPGGYPG